MTEFDFTLILSGIRDFTDKQVDALYEAGCDDATIAQRYGRVYMTFSRESESMPKAIVSAIEDVKKARVGASVRRVDTCNLVTKSEIARRIGKSRELVGKYVSGERGPGSFPAPGCNIVEGQPLWYWCEVTYWASANDIIREEANQEAHRISAINAILELENFKLIAPENTASLLRSSCQCCGPSLEGESLQDA